MTSLGLAALIAAGSLVLASSAFALGPRSGLETEAAVASSTVHQASGRHHRRAMHDYSQRRVWGYGGHRGRSVRSHHRRGHH